MRTWALFARVASIALQMVGNFPGSRKIRTGQLFINQLLNNLSFKPPPAPARCVTDCGPRIRPPGYWRCHVSGCCIIIFDSAVNGSLEKSETVFLAKLPARDAVCLRASAAPHFTPSGAVDLCFGGRHDCRHDCIGSHGSAGHPSAVDESPDRLTAAGWDLLQYGDGPV